MKRNKEEYILAVCVVLFVLWLFFSPYLFDQAPQVANLELKALQETNKELLAAKEHEYYRGVYASCVVILYKQKMPKDKASQFCLKLAKSAEGAEAHTVKLPGYDDIGTEPGTAPQLAPTPKPDRPKAGGNNA